MWVWVLSEVEVEVEVGFGRESEGVARVCSCNFWVRVAMERRFGSE